MADAALSKQLTDSCTAELMNCKHGDIQNVDLTPLGQQFLASLFKRLRRKEPPLLANYEPPNMALRFARDFDTVRRVSVSPLVFVLLMHAL